MIPVYARPVSLAAVLFATACGSTQPASLGDSPIREISCPTFLDNKACIERAGRQCEGGGFTVLSPMDDDAIGTGRTVPIEGSIQHRTITIRCHE